MVQTRWDHINREYSLLTRSQSVLLDGHFVVEHAARHRSGCFFNFNGTAGIWRRTAIEQAGGWQHDTLTEDLDLSYRAQAIGWQFVYLQDFATPGELPVELIDFKTQQHRWTKGAVQTARKLLLDLWRRPVPLKCKIEAGFHLLGHLCYPLMLLALLLTGPVCLARQHIRIEGAAWFDIPVLLATTVSFFVFYTFSQREIGLATWRSLALMPAVMGLGVGLSINNTFAVIEGWLQDGGEFVRTPKYHIEAPGDKLPGKLYRNAGLSIQFWLEWVCFGYFVTVGIWCALHGMWLTLPFVVLFGFGFGWVAMMETCYTLARRPALA